MKGAQKNTKTGPANENAQSTDTHIMITTRDWQTLKSFEDMLRSSIEAAEDRLTVVQNRHAAYVRLMERIENQRETPQSAEIKG